MNKIKLLGFMVAILFGTFIVVYGGIDDSPGGQLLGLVAVIIGIVGVIRSVRRQPDQVSETNVR
jgi:hypothetical protein